MHFFYYFTVLLCGLVGFSDFYKLDWLQSILTWQDQEVGCFGKEGELNHVKCTLKKYPNPNERLK